MATLGINSGIEQEKRKSGTGAEGVNDGNTGTEQEKYYCLITGANSGLGLALCCRFLAHFLLTRPAHHHLTVIFTTRSPAKSIQTTSHILTTLRSTIPPDFTSSSASSLSSRYTLAPAFVDLTDLLSVYTLISDLRTTYPKLDWVFCNAGILTTAGGGGVDYWKGTKDFLTDPIKALTLPEFKLQTPGEVVLQGPKPQGGQTRRLGTGGADDVTEDSSLGLIFCANVFGHYCLVRGVLPLLSRGGVRPGERSRVVWTSSLDGDARALNPRDIQCVRGTHLYESSKRLTDVLALTWGQDIGFADVHGDEDVDTNRLPRFYLTHPAVCATNIAGQHPVVWYIMLGLFYIVRVVCGSLWHPITAWKGNAANMFVAGESEEELERRGKVKWGSGCGRWGTEMVRETELEGVSGGKVSGEFKELGRECWERMEALRKRWEGRLGLA